MMLGKEMLGDTMMFGKDKMLEERLDVGEGQGVWEGQDVGGRT